MRNPADNGLSLFGGTFTVAPDLGGGSGKKKPPSGLGKRPPGNGALGKPPVFPRNGLGKNFSKVVNLPKSGAQYRA